MDNYETAYNTKQMTTALQPIKTNTELTRLGESVLRYIDSSKSQATRRAYASDMRDFTEWCAGQGASSLPAGADTVAGYISFMADSGAKSATIERRISAISVAHKHGGHQNPCRTELVRETLAGIKRTIGTAPTKKAPMRLDDLRAFCFAMPPGIIGARDRALLSVMFACARRRSEVVALNRDDIRFTSDGMVIHIKRSKTDQEGAGVTKRVPSSDSDVCAVKLMRAWLAESGITAGPVFRNIKKGTISQTALDSSSVNLIIKRAAMRAGMDPSTFGGHSGRSGFVTEAFDRGVAEADIMEVTDHKSQAVMRGYRRTTGAEQARAVAAVMADK